MAIVSFAEGNELYDITPIENIFILEYMQNAPGDYVKVYLLGLEKCYHANDDYSLSQMASNLSLEEEEVKQAFTYWAQFGLVEILRRRPFEVRYLNIKKTMQKSNGSRVNLYTHQPLVLELQRIFSGRRVLGTSEINYIMEWSDEWKIAPEIITLITAWCVSMKGPRISFSYINKVMGDIFDQGYTEYKQVEQYISQSDKKMSGAADVLKAWSISRLPTADEAELYRKWTLEYGMTKETIRLAQKKMTGVNNPNFKYLDTLIEELNQNNAITASQANIFFDEQEDRRQNAKEVFSLLGGLRLTDGRVKMYDSWRSMGFSKRSILKAAEALSREGYRAPEDLDSTLVRWHKQNMVSDNDIDGYMKVVAESARQVSLILEQWDENRAPKNYERKIYLSWIKSGYGKKLIDLACEKAKNAKDKMIYADKILSNWAEQGLKTPEQAEKHTGTGFLTSKKDKELSKDDYFNLYNAWEEL